MLSSAHLKSGRGSLSWLPQPVLPPIDGKIKIEGNAMSRFKLLIDGRMTEFTQPRGANAAR
jgi:hypothetical protein